jgi:hypothetical protein
MERWVGRLVAGLVFAGLAAIVLFALVSPPQDIRGDCPGGCRSYPVDRFAQVGIISVATVAAIAFGAAGIASRRRQGRLDGLDVWPMAMTTSRRYGWIFPLAAAAVGFTIAAMSDMKVIVILFSAEAGFSLGLLLFRRLLGGVRRSQAAKD